MPGRRTALETELSVFALWEYFPAANVPSTSVYVFADHIVCLVGLIGFQDVSGRWVSAQIGQWGVFTSFKYPLHLVGGISAVSHMLDDCLVWHRVHVNGLLYHPVE